MMTRAIVCVLLLAGCAETQSTARHQSGAFCSISNPRWPSASRDFDRQTTLEAIAALTDAAQADRDRLKAGAKSEVGGRLNALYERGPSSSAFISAGVAELATRLRQLDCAVRADRLAPAQADTAYAQILRELAAERATLGA